MSVTYGFYDSLNGDRKYSAIQMSSIFDGIILDGIFASIGTAFAVKAGGGLVVNVGIGRAWFNHTWTYNDSILPLIAPDSELLLDRIDAVVIEVDGTDSVRENSIKFVTGTPASSPVRPTMVHEGKVHQYPLCYIYRSYGSTEITQAEITNMIGTEECPFITGILKTVSLNELLGQWQSQLDQFVKNRSNDVDAWIAAQETEFTEWFNQMKSDLSSEQALLDQWIQNEQTDFLTWYNTMKNQLGADAAGNLQLQIDKEKINQILISGFVEGSKVFSDDGTVITTTTSDGRKLIKTFTNEFSTVTTVLKSSAGADVAKSVKTFNSDGTLIETVVVYY